MQGGTGVEPMWNIPTDFITKANEHLTIKNMPMWCKAKREWSLCETFLPISSQKQTNIWQLKICRCDARRNGSVAYVKHSNQFHHRSMRTFENWIYADVMKLVDVLDSKSCVGNHVPVRLRPSAYFLINYVLFGTVD